MTLIRNLSLGKKILIIPVVSTLGFLVLMGVEYFGGKTNLERLEYVRDTQFPVLKLVEANPVYLERITETLNSAVASSEQEQILSADKLAEGVRQSLSELQYLLPEQIVTLSELDGKFNRYYKVTRELSMNMITGNMDFGSAGKEIERMNKLLESVREGFSDFRNESYKMFAATIEDAGNATNRALGFSILISLMTVVVIITTSFLIRNIVVQNMERVVHSLKDIAEGEGDLTSRINKTSEDEIGSLVYWFNTFIERLQGIVGQIVKSTGPLVDVSQKLSDLVKKSDLNLQTQRSASESVKQIVEIVVSRAQTIDEHAKEAAIAAEDANNAAKEGIDIVGATVDSINNVANVVDEAGSALKELEKGSEEVGTVLDVISSVAEQTNLLALNAAIEAARAGEHGRGFAVVADEVRTLAMRTRSSTEEIHQIIQKLQDSSVKAVKVMEGGRIEVEISVEKAGKAGEVLKVIANKVDSISNMNMQIANATKEQLNVSAKIEREVDSINIMMNDTTQHASEVSELGDNVAHLANQLEGIGKQFKI